MVDPMHFEELAADYGRARPPYPAELWDAVSDLDLLRPGHHALDLGAGTGQATGPLLAAGLRVTAVEPGPRLAQLLGAEHPGADVIVSRAEDVELPDGSVDLVVAATSIHWMDLNVVLPMVRRLLTASGRFLVFRNVFGDPSVTTPFRDRIAEIVAARGGPGRPGFDAESIDATAAVLTGTGLFAIDTVATFRWSIALDADQVHALFKTFSDWTPSEVDRAAAAVDELGGRVLEHYLSWLIVASPKRAC